MNLGSIQHYSRLLVLSLGLLLAGQLPSAGLGAEVDFSHQVVPILRTACVECHSGREVKGGFSMNTRELMLESGHVDLDSPDDSYVLELVTSQDEEAQMPPAGRPRLTAAEVGTLRAWIAEGLPWEAGFTFAEVAYEPPLLPRMVVLPEPRGERNHPLDRLVDQYFLAAGVERPAPIDDRTFLRRVSLDLVGLLPSPAALRAFVDDPSPTKRRDVIGQLLASRRMVAEHWLGFYNDLLRNDYSGTGFITKGRTQITGWLYEALLTNKPFDQFARELIAPPSDASRGYIDGIKWRGEVSAGQTLEIQFAQSVSQSFLGINLKCASCHDSFIDRWTLEDAYGLAAIYAERPLELHRCDKPTGQQARPQWLFTDLGQVDAEAERQVRLQQLADLMTHPNNGRFTRTIVNRLWYRLMGRGIVHPLDAMQTAPWNDDLLDFLAVYFAEVDYDVLQVLELIASSEIYQSQAVALDAPVPGPFVFRGPQPRRLTAEQFMDAMWQLTGAAPQQVDAPVERAAADPLPANGLALVEEPATRASLLKNDALMRSLGRPTRDQIVSMRPNELTTLEAIDLANASGLASALEAGAERWLARYPDTPSQMLEDLFEYVLARPPTDQERQIVLAAMGEQPSVPQVQDLLWALCMQPEFWMIR